MSTTHTFSLPFFNCYEKGSQVWQSPNPTNHLVMKPHPVSWKTNPTRGNPTGSWTLIEGSNGSHHQGLRCRESGRRKSPFPFWDHHGGVRRYHRYTRFKSGRIQWCSWALEISASNRWYKIRVLSWRNYHYGGYNTSEKQKLWVEG